jgi:hypothetical protein
MHTRRENMPNESIEATAVGLLVEKIRPILAGHPVMVQGAVLSDLVAMLLAGHIGATPKMTASIRESVLKLHIDTVRKLVPPNSGMIHGRDA